MYQFCANKYELPMQELMCGNVQILLPDTLVDLSAARSLDLFLSCVAKLDNKAMLVSGDTVVQSTCRQCESLR